ncbi:glycosyl transferase [Weissella confusa]|uniref:glycosyltransferase family 32 protein n=1 Tax=Weissella confusa TaxID=1583 RepID=UPI0002465E23|nr:glycosyltransferase [Weissella confusa]MBJ7616514.1 glycosyl transferase [Weissella confusa]MBJ7626438.1 glycosyl transferase [Weissella confusa]MCT8392504.1 glycosyl transferase [Weissella confusa]CCF31655.1 Putative uncharacterized protein epsB [Weissella confusa LBAE C39-2]
MEIINQEAQRIVGANVPKIVHYAWFGAKMPDEVEKRVLRWKAVLPDWEFIEWNESNWDVNRYNFSSDMYKQGKLGYVADPLRFDVLNRFGGVYLDTDMEIKKDLSSFLNDPMTWGFMYENSLLTSFIMSVPQHPLLTVILNTYQGEANTEITEELYSMTSNPIITKIFKKQFSNFRLNGSNQVLSQGVHVYKLDYFSYLSHDSKANFAEHLFMNSWGSANHGVRGRIKYFVKMYFPYLWARISQRRGIKSALHDGLPLEK